MSEGNLNIIGVGNEKSEGLSRGVIVDIDETVESIRKAVRQAEQKIKHSNQGCYRWKFQVIKSQSNLATV